MNDHNHDDHDKDDLTEEEIRKMIDESKQVNKLKIGYDIGFILHKNFGYHVLFTLIVNLLSSSILIGLTSQIYPLIDITLVGFFVGMFLYTLMELIIKIIMIRFLLKPIIYSFGLILYIVNVTLFWLTDLMVDRFDYELHVENIFIFTIGFMLLRFIFTTYVRKAQWIQKGLK